ncbi:MAG: tetratricopeptide repeat protein, partial [Anaerolineae bacterium]|nr:tetratricopeptide repeat protein [Anaerolineae bacterium]
MKSGKNFVIFSFFLLIFVSVTPLLYAQDNSEDPYEQGIKFFADRNFDEAITAFNRAIELAPDEAKYYVVRGQVYMETGVLAQAIRDFDTAIENDPNAPLAYWYRSDAYFQLGELEKAAADYARAVEIDPSYANFYEELAFQYAKLGDTAQYLANRNRSIDLKHNYISVANNDYRLEIKRVWETISAKGSKPKNGVYLILETNLYNYTGEPLCISKEAVKATYEQETLSPTKMSQVQQDYYPGKPYLPGESPLCIESYQLFDTFLVYDLPDNLSSLTLEFKPNEQTALKFTLWLNEQREPQGEYLFALAQIDGEDYIEIVNIETTETVGRILDSYQLSVENCFGTADRTSQVSYTQQDEVVVGQETVDINYMGLGFPIPIPYLSKLIEGRLNRSRQSTTIEDEVYSLTV